MWQSLSPLNVHLISCSGAFDCNMRPSSADEVCCYEMFKLHYSKHFSKSYCHSPLPESHMIQLKALGQAGKWTSTGDCFVNCCFWGQESSSKRCFVWLNLIWSHFAFSVAVIDLTIQSTEERTDADKLFHSARNNEFQAKSALFKVMDTRLPLTDNKRCIRTTITLSRR